MQKKAASQSGIFNPRVLLAFTLCSVGSLLAMFSLAATPPVETTHANTSVPTDSRNFLSTFSSGAHHLPPGVPLPPGAQFSFNGQGDPLKQQPTAGFPGFAGMPFRPGTASGANALGTPRFANQQPAPLSMPQPFASESMPLVSAAQSNDWSIVSSPNTSATQHNALRGVTCVSASECWAVGYYLTDSAAQTLIERWDGTSWSIVSSPNTSTTQSNFLLGVTCMSASECWAVGYYYNDNVISQTLIERWDGTSWSIVSSPNTSTTDYNSLSGVTCVSASECWAVGYYFTGDNFVDQTLIERWDGTSWVDRQLAQHQHYGGQRRLRRDVRVSVGLLGRRLLLRTRRPHFSDSDRALGRELVDHRQLAQHQHPVQRPFRRDVRVGVGLLGRW